MIKFSPYIQIYNLSEEFEALNEVIWTFSKNLHGVSTAIHRLNIQLVSQKNDERKYLEGSIKSIWKYLDQSQICQNDERTNKELFLDLITECFLEIADDLGWDKDKINEARETSLREKLEFEYISKTRFNKLKTFKASLKLKLKAGRVSIYIIFSDKNNAARNEVHIIDTFLHHVSWFRMFKEAKWISDKEFGFVFSNEVTLSCSLDGKSGLWNHQCTEKELGFIKSLTYKKLTAREQRVDWMQK